MRKWLQTGSMLAVCAALACGGEVEKKGLATWEEFRAQATQETETGYFVFNGDELAENEGQLYEAWQRYLGERSPDGDVWTESSDDLIVNRVGGRDDKWSTTTAANITYCISSSSFGSRYSTVVSAMSSATGAWEAAGRVNFVHASSNDSRCSRTTGVVFNVRQVSGQSYLARAFFPSNSRSAREILIDSSSFGSISPYTLTGILRHELGHTLGFRHEHTRPEARTCFEDNNWRALTTYDSASVMHYPQCNGTNRGDLVLTTKDKAGTAALYP